jgi:hypothetical protein
MANETRNAAWKQTFNAATPELRRIMLSIVQTEHDIADLERNSASVGELLPHIRKLHDLRDRESELRGTLPRARRLRAPQPATRRP